MQAFEFHFWIKSLEMLLIRGWSELINAVKNFGTPFLVLLKELGGILDKMYFVFWTKLHICFQDCLVLRTRSTIYEYQNKPGSCSVTALEGLLSLKCSTLNSCSIGQWQCCSNFWLRTRAWTTEVHRYIKQLFLVLGTRLAQFKRYCSVVKCVLDGPLDTHIWPFSRTLGEKMLHLYSIYCFWVLFSGRISHHFPTKP